MRVSQLAERAGTSAKTIRFYEAQGILPDPPRAENGYREYGDADVPRDTPWLPASDRDPSAIATLGALTQPKVSCTAGSARATSLAAGR